MVINNKVDEVDELTMLRERLNKHKKNTQKASTSYYERNYVIREGMSDEEIERVKNNIQKRRERERVKYEKNKEYHRVKNKKWRDKQKLLKDEIKK